MKFRSRPFPRTINDWATTLFLALAIPITYWFELWIILPELFSTDSIFYYLNFILGTFVMFGIMSNMAAMMLCNTSIVGRKITRPPKGNAALWKFCAACESLSPPRARHCTTCRVCILKRDHHCMFTGNWMINSFHYLIIDTNGVHELTLPLYGISSGCCIGHYNQRYFIHLLFYLCIGATYSSILNSYFLWFLHSDEFRNGVTLIKIVFPLAMLMYDTSIIQGYLLMYLLNIVGAAFGGFLLYYHMRNILRGCLTHETIRQFDVGPIENIRIVFGERWYLTWISPFVESKLPFDGIDWQQIFDKTTKNL